MQIPPTRTAQTEAVAQLERCSVQEPGLQMAQDVEETGCTGTPDISLELGESLVQELECLHCHEKRTLRIFSQRV